MRNEYEDRLSATDADHAASAEAPTTDAVRGEEPAIASKPAVVEEVLIEEVSIDGMCGVY